jgi:hypothetical protein
MSVHARVELDDFNAIPASADAERPVLHFQTLAELRAEVAAVGPRKWLVRGLWPSCAYGAHAAEMKAQKTWNALDLAVSIASGTPWLGFLPIDDPGPVLVFAGEGGKPNIVRRLAAICDAKGLDPDDLAIVICARAPHLSDQTHLELMAQEIETLKPKLVLLDPFYLAAQGADGKDLYAMGKLLERPQHICDNAGAALLVVTHYNRREGKGAMRFTGAGPAEWGRVLIGARVVSRKTDPDTLETTVISELHVIGGEVPDQTFRIKRTIRADDPDDIDSPLRYAVERQEASAETKSDDLPPAACKLLEAARTLGRPATNKELVDQIAKTHGHGLRRETVSKHLNELERSGHMRCLGHKALEKHWEAVETRDPAESDAESEEWDDDIPF